MQCPGPWIKADPANGNTDEYRSALAAGKVYKLFYSWALEYGTIFKYLDHSTNHNGIIQHVVVADPHEAKRLLAYTLRKPKSYEDLKLLGKGVLSINDRERWKFQRNILKAAFSQSSLREIFPIVYTCSGNIVRNLEDNNIYEVICHTTFEMIGHIALGEKTEFLSEHVDKLRRSFDITILKGLTKEKDGEYINACKYMDDFADKVFARANPFPDSLLDLILKNDFTDEECRDQLFTFMFAGHETTANTISWILIELANNQDIQKRLYLEIKDAHIEKYQDIFKFNYLTKVIREGMRLRTVVTGGTVRVLDTTEIIMGEKFSPGTVISFPNYTMHLHPDNWKDPFKFDPDREWNNNNFSPFTRGPRDCMGRNLALMEIRIVLILILKEFKLIGKNYDKIDGFSIGTMKPVEIDIHLVRRNEKGKL